MRAITKVLVVLTTAASSILAQNTPIVVPAGTATGIGLASAATYQLGHDAKWKDYEDVVILSVLNGVYKASVNSGQTKSPPDFTGIAAELRTALDSKMPAYPVFADEGACLRYTIDSLMLLLNSSPDPSLKIALAALENAKLTRLESPINTARQYPANMGLSAVAVNAPQFVGDQVQEASDLAQDNRQYAAAVSPVLIDLLGLDASAAYGQIESAFPGALPALPASNTDGSYTLSPQDLLSQYQTVIAQVEASIDSTLSSMRPPVQTNVVPGSPIHSGVITIQGGDPPQNPPACKTALQIIVATDACTPDLANGAQGTITGISKLFGVFDSGTASQISTVGGAVINAGKAISQLGIISSGGGILGDVGDVLGVLGPVGSLIGAGVSIFQSLFGSTPNPNAAVLQQIQKLSQQIADLQNDMNSQFDQVNANLSTILTTLNSDFAQINFELGVLNSNVQDIQASLLDIQTQLNQLAVLSREYFDTLDYETLIQDLNGCLNYQANNNGADIGPNQYTFCENALYSWATFNVTDGLWAGTPPPDYTDQNIYNFFLDNTVQGVCNPGCATPFSADVNYLAQFPTQNLNPTENLNLPALSNTRLPNPDMWTLVARSYLQLAREWPQYAVTKSSSRLDDVIQVGASLQQAVHNANTIASGAGPIANQALYNALLSKYTAAASSLNAAFTNVVTQAEDTALHNNPTDNFNPWGGPDQATTYIPPALQQPITSAAGLPPITPPPGLDAFVFNVVKLVDQFGIFPLTLSYSVGNPAGMAGYPQVTCPQGYTPWYMEITGTASLVVFERVGLFCGRDGANEQAVLQSWQNDVGGIRSHWAQTAIEVMSPDSQAIDLNYLTQRVVDSILTPIQQAIYGQISTALKQGNLESTGQELSGIKVLTEAYVNFGLPQSLQNNDALQAALYGPVSLKDGASIEQDFAQWSTAPPDLTDNRIQDELNAMGAGSLALMNALTQVLNQIQQSGTPDSLPEIDTTLQDLQAFETVKNAAALSACSYQLSSGSSNMASVGGQINLTVTTGAGCPVAAGSASSWLKVNTKPVSSSVSQVSIHVAQASGTVARSASVVVGDQVYHVSQYPTHDACLYSLTAPSAMLNAPASTGTVGVIATPGCAWTVSGSLPSWLTLTSGTSGMGNGTVQFSLSANASLVIRTASLMIAGQLFTFSQRGNITPAKIVSPIPGSTLQSRTVTFQWTAGTGVSGTYQLAVGTAGPGSSDVTITAVSGTSVTIQGLPANSAPLYVRLYSIDASSAGDWLYNDYIFTEAGAFMANPIVATN